MALHTVRKTQLRTEVSCAHEAPALIGQIIVDYLDCKALESLPANLGLFAILSPDKLPKIEGWGKV